MAKEERDPVLEQHQKVILEVTTVIEDMREIVRGPVTAGNPGSTTGDRIAASQVLLNALLARHDLNMSGYQYARQMQAYEDGRHGLVLPEI